MNISKRLKIASQLARCQHAIQQLRDSVPVEESEWVLNLFYISGANEDAGQISFLMAREKRHDKDLEQILVKTYELNNKILEKQELNSDDWKFILDGLLMYRTDLLMKSSWMSRCTCEF